MTPLLRAVTGSGAKTKGKPMSEEEKKKPEEEEEPEEEEKEEKPE